jgi:predicted methyltransferase
MGKHRFSILTALLASCALTAIAVAEPLPPNIAAAAADPARADQAVTDAMRHGPEILAFAGVASGAKVVDLIPGGGYWTKLFAKAVGLSGHVYGLWPAEYAKVDDDEPGPYGKIAGSPGFTNVSVLDQPAAKLTTPEKVDLVFTAQNYHDYLDKFMGPVDPMVLNKAVFAALKPGGIYLIIDHVAQAGSGARDTDTLHRIDPETVKAQVLQAAHLGPARRLQAEEEGHAEIARDLRDRGGRGRRHSGGEPSSLAETSTIDAAQPVSRSGVECVVGNVSAIANPIWPYC